MNTATKMLLTVFLVACPALVFAGLTKEVRSPDGTTVAISKDDCTVELLDITSGKQLATLYEPVIRPKYRSEQERAAAEQQMIRCVPLVSFAPDGKLLATQRPGQSTILWNVRDGREVGKLLRPLRLGDYRRDVNLVFSSDSRLLLEVAKAKANVKLARVNRITLWDLTTRRVMLDIREGENAEINKVGLSPDGRTLMAIIGFGTSARTETGERYPTDMDRIKLWDIETARELATLKGQFAKFSSDGKSLVVADFGRQIIWDIMAGKISEPARRAGPRTAKGIEADNVAQSIGNNKWNWTVFIKGDGQDLDNVKCVEYKLHPTFPNPLRLVCESGDPQHPFGLSATGWGTFSIGIRVFMKDGTHRDLIHQLKF